jgi:hypothetical protein
MTDKLTLTNLSSLENQTTAISQINANSAAIVTAIDNTLSRDGTSPNQMGANLDMNSNHILNLPVPATVEEPLRLGDALSSITNTNGTLSSLTANGVLYGTTVSAATSTVALTNGQLVVGNTSAAPAPVTMSGDATLSHTGAITIANNAVTAAKMANATITTSQISNTAAITGTQLATNTVANSNLAQMATHTIKGNNTSGTANAADLTIPQVTALFTNRTRQVFTSSSGTYTTPTNCKYINVRMVGGGGGGAGSGTSAGDGTAGSATTFGSSFLTSNGGALGTAGGEGGAGGASIGGDLNLTGGKGAETESATIDQKGGQGGISYIGGYGAIPNYGVSGFAAQTNSGGGGSGAGCAGTASAGGGGGAGGYLEKLITSPSSTYAYAIGGAGAGGTAGTNGFVGGAGAAGHIIVDEFYS